MLPAPPLAWNGKGRQVLQTTAGYQATGLHTVRSMGQAMSYEFGLGALGSRDP